MPKMTKAQGRKRLIEASDKCFKVLSECHHISPAQRNKLFKLGNELASMAAKMK